MCETSARPRSQTRSGRCAWTCRTCLWRSPCRTLGSIAWTRAAQLLALVKPTFELGSGLLVADAESVAKTESAVAAGAESCDWTVLASTPAPSTGDPGPPEVFVYARRAEG